MALKRIVDTSFWTDDKVMDMFSPEDKLFMLYLMTNPHTTQLGIYQINLKYMALELGYSKDSISVLINRFENKYHIIKYSKKTQEIGIKNYLKYSIIKGGAPVRDCLVKEIKQVKNKELITWIFSNIKDYENLNETVKNIIKQYEETNGIVNYSNEKQNDNVNDNENDNDNDVSLQRYVNESYHDTLNECNVSVSEPLQQPIITLTLNTKEEYPIYQSDIDDWKDIYPNVDVLQELRKMKGWLNANPTRRKTKKGIARFINNWLSKEQDKPHYNQQALHNVDVEEEKEEESKKTMMSDEELKLLLDQVKDGVF